MGGNVALLYAGIRPERVRRACSLEGFGLPRAAAGEAPDRYRDWLNQLRAPPAFGEFPSFDDLAHYLVRRNPRLDRARADFIARSWAVTAPGGTVRIVADPAHKRVNPYRYRRDEAEACWRRITAPALLVLGADSDYRHRLGADGDPAALAAAFPQVRVELLEDAGHMLHHERPEAIAAIVEAFLLE